MQCGPPDQPLRAFVLGHFSGAQKWHICASFTGDSSNFLGIARNNDSANPFDRTRLVNGPSNQRTTGQGPNVLSWQPFGTASGTNQGNDFHTIVRGFSRPLSSCLMGTTPPIAEEWRAASIIRSTS